MTGMPSPMGHTLLRDKESTGPDKPVRHLAPTTSEHGPTTVRGQPTRGGNMWQGRLGTIGLILAAAIFALPLYAPTSGANRANQVEVYSWWTGPGEEDGLRAMVADFEAKNPGVRLIHAAGSGGARSARTATRACGKAPPAGPRLPYWTRWTCSSGCSRSRTSHRARPTGSRSWTGSPPVPRCTPSWATGATPTSP